MLRVYILTIFLSFFLSGNSQSTNEDSLHLSKHLEPFRQHLDSVTAGINARYLLNLYDNNFSNRQRLQPEKEPIQAKKINVQSHGDVKSKKIWPTYKYSYNEIIPNDTNHILFIETEYDLPNSNELENIKVKYIKSKFLKDQIYACVNYISELNRFYPSRNNWKFSRSQTLNKYINYTANLIEKLPKDTTKAYILCNFGNVLNQVDRVELQSYILRLYLKAERILISPYNNYLKANSLSDDSIYFRKYINYGSIGKELVNINYYISNLLEPEEGLDLKNELYPFLKKRLFYLGRALKTFEILKGKNNLPQEYTNAEEKYLKALTVFKVSDKSKYYSSILYDRILLLKDYLSKLLFPRTDSLTKKREYNLYYTVGCIFLFQQEYDYALKAFYKASEIRLNFTSVPMKIEDVPIFIDIFETIQKDIKRKSYNQELVMTDMVNLYLNIVNSEIPLNRYDSSFFDIFKLLGQSSLMIYKGQSDEAERLLITKKRQLFQDTIFTNYNPELFGLLYRVLINTTWRPDKESATSNTEREADSVFYLFKVNGFLDVETSYNGDEYLSEKLSSLEEIENDTKWYAKTEELSEEINQKTSEITSLNIIRSSLNRKVSSLNGTVASLEKNVGLLNKSLLLKKDEIEVLSDSILQKNKTLDTISKQNDKLEKNIKSVTIRLDSLNKYATNLQVVNNKLNSTKKTLIWIVSLLLLGLFAISIIIINKIIRIKTLNQEIVNKEKEAEEKDLGKKLAEQRLLNDTALGHDLIEIVAQIPLFVEELENQLSEGSVEHQFAKNAHNYSKEVNEYFNSNFDLRGELLNTVQNEINLALKYCSIWELTQECKGKVTIIYTDIDSTLLNDIKIPKHNLVNFISNAFRHGGIGKKEITINIRGCKTKEGYVITVEDDGTGFNDLGLENKKGNRGINLVLSQIENFNSIKNNPYKIEFSIEDIKNKIVDTKSEGVIVTYKIVKK